MTNKAGIYLIRNIQTYKVYVGSAVDIKKRWRQHRSELQNGCHGNQHLQSSWNKHGKDAFEFKVSIRCSKEDLIKCEQLMIDIYKRDIGWDMIYNMNLTAGSNLGMKLSVKSRAKISKAKMGHQVSQETRDKIGRIHRGKKISPETRANMCKAQRGKKFSLKTRAKLSKAKRGHSVSPETRAKIGAANRGRKHTPEARANMSKGCRAWRMSK